MTLKFTYLCFLADFFSDLCPKLHEGIVAYEKLDFCNFNIKVLHCRCHNQVVILQCNVV